MLRDLAQQAHRLDRSLSWCGQRAWTLARTELRTLGPVAEHPRAEATYEERYASDDAEGEMNVRKQTLFFPSEMLEEIKEAAQRQDRSLSWLMQRAWCLAVSEIEKLRAE